MRLKSQFDARWRANDDEAAQGGGYLPKASGSGPDSNPSDPETILVVEDQDLVRELVAEVLQLEGYTVLEAANGREAFELAASYPKSIELLLTDMVMPDESGPELADRIRALRPELKVVYMSGYDATLTDKRLCGEMRRAYLQKPFTAVALAEKVRETLARPLGSSGHV